MKGVIRKENFKTTDLAELKHGEKVLIICNDYRQCEAAAASARMYRRRHGRDYIVTLDGQTLTVEVTAC